MKRSPLQATPQADLIKTAVRLFRSDLVPRSVRRHNARAWLRSVTMLGDKYVLLGGPAKWSGRRA